MSSLSKRKSSLNSNRKSGPLRISISVDKVPSQRNSSSNIDSKLLSANIFNSFKKFPSRNNRKLNLSGQKTPIGLKRKANMELVEMDKSSNKGSVTVLPQITNINKSVDKPEGSTKKKYVSYAKIPYSSDINYLELRKQALRRKQTMRKMPTKTFEITNFGLSLNKSRNKPTRVLSSYRTSEGSNSNTQFKTEDNYKMEHLNQKMDRLYEMVSSMMNMMHTQPEPQSPEIGIRSERSRDASRVIYADKTVIPCERIKEPGFEYSMGFMFFDFNGEASSWINLEQTRNSVILLGSEKQESNHPFDDFDEISDFHLEYTDEIGWYIKERVEDLRSKVIDNLEDLNLTELKSKDSSSKSLSIQEELINEKSFDNLYEIAVLKETKPQERKKSAFFSTSELAVIEEVDENKDFERSKSRRRTAKGIVPYNQKETKNHTITYFSKPEITKEMDHKNKSKLKKHLSQTKIFAISPLKTSLLLKKKKREQSPNSKAIEMVRLKIQREKTKDFEEDMFHQIDQNKAKMKENFKYFIQFNNVPEISEAIDRFKSKQNGLKWIELIKAYLTDFMEDQIEILTRYWNNKNLKLEVEEQRILSLQRRLMLLETYFSHKTCSLAFLINGVHMGFQMNISSRNKSRASYFSLSRRVCLSQDCESSYNLVETENKVVNTMDVDRVGQNKELDTDAILEESSDYETNEFERGFSLFRVRKKKMVVTSFSRRGALGLVNTGEDSESDNDVENVLVQAPKTLKGTTIKSSNGLIPGLGKSRAGLKTRPNMKNFMKKIKKRLMKTRLNENNHFRQKSIKTKVKVSFSKNCSKEAAIMRTIEVKSKQVKNLDWNEKLFFYIGEGNGANFRKLFFAAKASPNLKNCEGETLVNFAAKCCNIKLTRFLLENHADPNIPDVTQ